MMEDELGEYERYLREVAHFATEQESKLDSHVNQLHHLGNNQGGGASGENYETYEQDVIREAYSSATYTSIRDLPNRLKSGEVALARQMKMIEQQRLNLVPEDVLQARRAALRNNGLFHQFEYVPSSYTLQKELEAKERIQAKLKALELGGGREFVCSGGGKKAKYEDGFGDKTFRYPYLGGSFEEADDKAERDVNMVPFLPTGKSGKNCFDSCGRERLPDIIRSLTETFQEDWDECEFEVTTSADDYLVVRFDLVSLDGELVGLKAYMNVLEASNKDVRRFGLNKYNREWASEPGDGNIYFFFQLPWTRKVKDPLPQHRSLDSTLST